jgi:protoporphyrinogen oxidase
MIIASYLKAKLKHYLRRTPEIESFEEWVIHCFGSRLYKTFFKTYTEKVWGIPCNEIRADWAAQRIQNMSLKAAVKNAVFGSQDAKSLIKTFDYPRLGPGMMWERCQQILEQKGSLTHLNTEVKRIKHKAFHVTKVLASNGNQSLELKGEYFVNSMPLALLVHRLEPLPPAEVLEAAMGLKYRDFLIVTLIIKKKALFPDNWLYIHSPEFQVGRIQNFKNWSPWMVPDQTKTCLGMEYFCSQGDELWELEDKDLLELASAELAELGLGAEESDVEDGCVIRQRKAYPVYDGEYKQNLNVIKTYLSQFDNLQTIGRNGMHRYNNQDHSMLTALLAAKNIVGENHEIWSINVDRSYHENFTDKEWKQRQTASPSKLKSNETRLVE